MEWSISRKITPIELGDVVRMETNKMEIYMISKGVGTECYLTDLSTGEILEFGTYSIGALVDVAKLELICKNDDLYITNRKQEGGLYANSSK